MNENPLVLIVDDHAEILENLSFTLQIEGFNVLTAENGMKAIELLEANEVALVLADISMPGLNGYQLLDRIRANPEWANVQFVFITARTIDSDVRYGKELGADDYLTKPIHPLDLLAAVRGRLRRAQQLSNNGVAATSTDGEKNHRSRITETIVLGRLRIEPTKYDVKVDNQSVHLSAHEYTLLMHLALQPGDVVTTEDLVQVTHKFKVYDDEAGTLIRPLIRSLRRKLGYEVGDMGCIENIRGVGYRITTMN